MKATPFFGGVTLPHELADCTGRLLATFLGARLCEASNDNPQDVRQFARRIAAHAFLFARLADSQDDRESCYLDSDEAELVEESLCWRDTCQPRTRALEITIGRQVIEQLIAHSGQGELSERQLAIAPLAAGFGLGIRLLNTLDGQLFALAAAAMPAVSTAPMFHELVRAYERNQKPRLTPEQLVRIKEGAEAMLPYAVPRAPVNVPDVVLGSDIDSLRTLLKRK